MVRCVGGLAVELAAWLGSAFKPDLAEAAEPAFYALLRYVYHAGRAEALEAAARALERAGHGEAASALWAALEVVEAELEEAALELGEYDHVAGEVAIHLSRRKARAAALGAAGHEA